ncbi:MAG: Holliday junction resolvase RuvX [Halothiobacillus sp. 14-56-357]|jgi:putative Holliday junction resolvase|uniref:Holliday junction resolvase RuvX n=1 Tax=Halothiobacillus sp. 15-55-196 TaxID=1970382 RepID=UPI000BDA6892|nr:Holliday junction resolvase RuvX [Halothiobacillus sp. 15-55-196]OZB37489.1 MAG: Holliday junction resolvase RuvX [Halothiobacillus sp. 15-55-196]OZB57704.1 MAG: Holliday junction resolvase RuvX [Halothiobacillus sp. 14-56-357]OZB79529.1 MAG: Holliday junction resolvase RuvX [Halothiobacillus sp. 13-55-115]
MKASAPPGTWLAFDYGAWRIGVAVGEHMLGSARPLTTLHHRNVHQIQWDIIGRLLDEWRPVGLVLGWPVMDSGEPYPVAEFIRRFGRRLEGRFNLPVRYVDERLSSENAQMLLTALHGRNRVEKSPGMIDAQAAAIILETFFSQSPVHSSEYPLQASAAQQTNGT